MLLCHRCCCSEQVRGFSQTLPILDTTQWQAMWWISAVWRVFKYYCEIYIFRVMYQVRDFSQTHPVTGRATCFQVLVWDIYINICEWRIRQSRMYQVRDFSQTHSSPVTGRVMNWCSVPCFRILVWDIYFEMICAIYPTILMCGCTLELFYPTIVIIGMGFFY